MQRSDAAWPIGCVDEFFCFPEKGAEKTAHGRIEKSLITLGSLKVGRNAFPGYQQLSNTVRPLAHTSNRPVYY